MKKIGIYIHVPFCRRKCPYCDFYSISSPDEAMLEGYTRGVIDSIRRWAAELSVQADTLYFGGGTPSLLGGKRIARLIGEAAQCFSLFDDGVPEITMEANPAEVSADTLAAFAEAGGNRLSLGMQSAVKEELAILGRRHCPADVAAAVMAAHRVGIANISLDVMLGISGQTAASAVASVREAAALGATHVSAYMLKLEPETPYGKTPPPLPEEDAVADTYLIVAEELRQLGYGQYEISNFAREGMESRHNLKYWDSQPYLGIGPAASSCIGGRRFTYPRDVEAFLKGDPPLEETDELIPAGSALEYALLRLRLTAGLTETGFARRFGEPIPIRWRQRAERLPEELVQVDDDGIRLTAKGFLLSNSLTGHILDE